MCGATVLLSSSASWPKFYLSSRQSPVTHGPAPGVYSYYYSSVSFPGQALAEVGCLREADQTTLGGVEGLWEFIVQTL